jgi:cathepsin B
MNLKLFNTYLGTTQTTVNNLATHTSTATKPPALFDGRKLWKSSLAPIQNQGECGACYAFATTSVLQTRYWLFTNNEIRPSLNPLAGLVCHPTELTKLEHRLLQFDSDFQKESERLTQFTACSGGTLAEMARYYYRLGAVENECISQKSIQTYILKHNELPLCDEISQKATCTVPGAPKRYWPVLDFYIVSDSTDAFVIAEAMKADICFHGPMLVGFWIYEDFLSGYDGKSIYVPAKNQVKQGGHAVYVVGWGRESNMDYWICANSWGKDWGDHGFFRMQIGNEELETEFNHLGIVPQVPGIGVNFVFLERRSQVEDFDDDLRASANVNPFTLLTAETTTYMQDNDLPIELVFSKLQYPSSSALSHCCEQLSKQSQADFPALFVMVFFCAFFVALLAWFLVRLLS